MRYYSTENRNLKKNLKDAVLQGLAEDNGLFMPENFPVFQSSFLKEIRNMSFSEISSLIAIHFFGDDIPACDLEEITTDAISFETPLVRIHDNVYTLELFHGPTFAFKDVGARFMARLLGYFIKGYHEEVNVLVATSGDTGSAVANGFLKIPGIRVHILYPKGLVSILQEKQFTTLGENITAIEIDGTFDDCQRLVKSAFLDKDLRQKITLSSANSINLARLIPQTFYYFNGYAQLEDPGKRLYISVPSGNFGNLTAALMAGRMGLPVIQFISPTNVNDIVPEYLKTGIFTPKPSVATIANAMDVGNPSNFVRILDMYDHSHEAIKKDIAGYSFTDAAIRKIIKKVYEDHGYLLDPHGATGYQSLSNHIGSLENAHGFFIETAHPAKFRETVEEVTGIPVEIPASLKATMGKPSKSIPLSKEYEDFKEYLI